MTAKKKRRPRRPGAVSPGSPLPLDAPERGAAAAQGHPPAKKPTGLANLLLHLHPRMVPAPALKLTRTFGLGGMALALFLVLILTGALLLFAYAPSTERAYASIVSLRDDVPFGSFVRALHHWAGNGLLLLAVLHLLRVFYTGAYLPPRRLNWELGLAMLVLAAAANFTGYLLPWDQLAFWAVTIGTGMLRYVPVAGETLVRMARGGPEVGPATLSLFFVLHIALLPILLLLLTAFHFWLVRKAGGVALPASATRDARPGHTLVPVRPNLTLREGVAALALLAVLLTLSAVVAAPLEDQANAGMSPNPAKAPWYFMGFQELLVHLHPAFAVLVVPLLGAAFLAGLPLVARSEVHTGLWFHSGRGRRAVVWAALVALVLTPAAVVAEERLVKASPLAPGWPPILGTGLLPAAVGGAGLAAFLVLLRRLLGLSRLELVQAAFTFLAAAFLVLTVVGVFFRGESMQLSWPWGASG